VPGPPRVETCNAFDDDCDGVIDNGANLCSEGRMCANGFCVTAQEAAEMAAMQKPTDGGAPADGGVPMSGSPPGGSPSAGAPKPAGGSEQPLEAPRPKLGCAMAGGFGGGALPSLLAGASILLGVVRARRRRRP
jgi:hypothetical protein